MVFSLHLDEKLLKEPDRQQQQIPNPLMRPVFDWQDNQHKVD